MALAVAHVVAESDDLSARAFVDAFLTDLDQTTERFGKMFLGRRPRPRYDLYGRLTKYATREAYVAEMLPRRLQLLSEVLSAAPREIVVCYGKAHWAHYESFIKATKWKGDPNFRVSVGHGPRVVFCKHFSARGFNTNEKS